MRAKISASSIAIAALALGAAPPALPQSAEEVIETAVKRYEQRMSGVENYTLVHDIMGMEVSNYFVKRMIDGRSVFQISDAYGSDDDDALGQMYNQFMMVADRAALHGTESLDGKKTYVLSVEDFSGLDWGSEMGDEQMFTPKKGLFYLDSDEYILRKMVMEGEMETEGGTSPVTMEALFQDYREVKGMLHPFRTTMTMTGVTAGMSEEEVEEARQSLEELKQQMESMPEAQREMMESMMKDQLERLEEMVNSGNMEFTLEVKELRVNEGPPKGT